MRLIVVARTTACYMQLRQISSPSVILSFGKIRVCRGIDPIVIDVDGVYYRFTKDEGNATGCVDIFQESSTSLLATNWTTIDTCIGTKAGTANVEGPSIFKSKTDDANGDKYYLFVDEYTGRHYIPLETEDITNPVWQLSSSYSLPSSLRHGTVLPVTAAELETLIESATATSRTQLEKRQGSRALSG
ncbi:hypothetical protein BJ170DRAFT_683930 [Xylariales sp. AK1849]|nr:hypothetical protein BJ170DRAFT_683930 [Xylariales sp. AK1849]